MRDVEELVDQSTVEQRASLFDELIGRLESDANTMPPATVEYSIKTILRLIEIADAYEHSFMSMRVACIPDLPPALASALAASKIAIAAPILSMSDSLGEQAIIEIARACSKDHLMAIAERPDLTEGICDALLERRSVEVATALIDNPTAKLSGPAFDMLARLAAHSQKLEERLCGRADLPEALAGRLMQRVTMRLQLQMGPAITGLEADTIRMALRTSKAESGFEVTDTQALSQRALVEVAKIAARGQLDEARLGEFIAGGRVDLVACAFGRMCDVEPAIARRILLADGEEALIVAARAIPLSTETFVNLVRLARTHPPLSDDMAAELMRGYEDLPVATARQIMQFHKKRRELVPSKRSEHARPHDAALAARLGAKTQSQPAATRR